MDSYTEEDDSQNNNLIVNYLPPSMTEDEISKLFSSVGEVCECKLIRDKLSKHSMGYAFVNFKSPDDAKKAIGTLDKLRLQDKTIKVSYARPSSSDIKNANLYVSGLPETMSIDELEAMFSSFGVIITSKILTHPDGKSRGAGFIRFDKHTQAEIAIRNLNGTIPEGALKQITVKFANPPHFNKQKRMPESQLTSPNGDNAMVNGRGRGYGNSNVGPVFPQGTSYRYSPMNPVPSAPMSMSMASTNHSTSFNGTTWCIFVYNLPPDSDEKILYELFAPYGAILNTKVVRDPEGKPKGFGFVNMPDYQAAFTAICGLNGKPMPHGKTLQVSFKAPRNK
ncbi:ELAV 3 isoform X10 [Paramuricea clavata]|uniref:ELAV 3 isoform X10 n=1 Tax=Paramuricea clavata TaxID=317549 RepID=A0A6S7FH01_PARCT|nr:ELAV 3 isoform X10 [Paramuricea clavata]